MHAAHTHTSDQRPVDLTHCTVRIILRARATFTHSYSVLCSLLSSQHFFCSLDMAKRQVTSVFPHRSPCLLHESSHSKCCARLRLHEEFLRFPIRRSVVELCLSVHTRTVASFSAALKRPVLPAAMIYTCSDRQKFGLSNGGKLPKISVLFTRQISG